jgi:hypothetical protein
LQKKTPGASRSYSYLWDIALARCLCEWQSFPASLHELRKDLAAGSELLT